MNFKQFSDLTQEDIQAYRKVFLNSEDGQRVLARMLNHLHFFGVAETQEEVALRNFASGLIHILGGFSKGHIIEYLVSSMADDLGHIPINKSIPKEK